MLETFPDSTLSYVFTGRALLEGGDYAAAEPLLAEAVRRSPDDPGVFASWANRPERQREWGEAARRWAEMRARFPDHVWGYVRGGQALLHAGQHEEAELLLSEAAGLFLQDAGAQTAWAECAMRRRDWAEAARRWSELRKRLPECQDGYRQGIACLCEVGRTDEAEAITADAMLRFPEVPGFATAYADIARRRADLGEAIRRYTDARDRFAGDPLVHLGLADVLLIAGRHDQADAVLSQAKQRFSDDPVFAARYTKLTASKRELPELLAQAADPEANEEELYAAAQKLLDGGKPAEARHMLNRLAEKFGPSDKLRFQLELAQTAAALGDVEQALAILHQLRAEYPPNWHAFRIEAEVLVSRREYATALEVLRSAPVPSHPGERRDLVFRGIRLAIYVAAAGTRATFAEPALAPACDNVVAAMMVRDEADIIAQQLHHHYRLGFRKFALMLNCCRDDTAAIIERFRSSVPDALICTVDDPVEGYYQSDKTQALLNFAAAYFAAIRQPASWCFVLDADEFLCAEPGVGIGELIAKADEQRKDFITFHLCDATSAEAADFDLGGDIYRHFDVVAGCKVPVVTKNAFRFAVDPKIEMGNHALYYPDLSVDRCFVAAQVGGRLVHLAYRSRAQMKTKIVNGGSAYKAAILPEGFGAHWRERYREFLERGEAIFEERMAEYHKETMHAAAQQAPFAF